MKLGACVCVCWGGGGVTKHTCVCIHLCIYVSNVCTEGVGGLAEMFLGWLLIEVM